MICAICHRDIPPSGTHTPHAHTPAELDLTRTMVDEAAGHLIAIAFLYLWSTHA